MKSARACNGIARSPKIEMESLASLMYRCASSLLFSNPNSFTYVVLLTLSSFPAVFPKVVEEAVQSKISSATRKIQMN